MTPARTAIAAHRAAYEAFQVAVGDAPSLEAEDAYDAVSEALVATVCASRADAEALLAHLRWWVAEEVEFREAREPAYGIAVARIADLAAWLEPAGPAEPDPIFAAIDAANRAGWDHLSALAGLDEADEVQMRRANAAADADTAAFEALTQTMPTSMDGLRALVERYAVEAEGDDPTGTSGRYLRHIVRALSVVPGEARL